MAKSTFDDSASHCNDQNKCDSEGIAIRNDAIAKGNVGTGLFVAGAVLAAGGVVLWVTAPSAPRSVGVTMGPGSVLLQGAF